MHIVLSQAAAFEVANDAGPGDTGWSTREIGEKGCLAAGTVLDRGALREFQ